MAMNDPYGLELSGLPPEFAAEARGLTRNQAIQEALLKRSLEPSGGLIDAGNFKVAPHWSNGASKVLQAYLARQGLEEGDRRAADLGGRYQARVGDSINQFMRTAQGAPGSSENIVDETGADANAGGAGLATVTAPAVAGDPRKAVMNAMMDPYLKSNPNLGALSKMVTPDWEVVEQYGPDGSKQKVLIDKRNPTVSTPFGGTQRATPMFRKIGVEVAGKEGTPHHQDQVSNDGGRTWKKVEGSVPTPIFAKSVPSTVVVSGDDKHAPVAVVRRGPDGKDDPKLGVEFVTRKEAVSGKRTPAAQDATTQGNVAHAKALSSPGALKELIQTDEEIQAGSQVITGLSQARAINEAAMGFLGAGVVSKAASLLPEELRPKSVDDTANLDNIVTSTVLPQLKTTFGGNPTEGERKILLDVAGSVNQNPAVRAEIFKRAEAAVQARMKFAQDKSASLRGGTYTKPDGAVAPQLPGGKSSPPAPAGLPAGSKLIGKTPDGTKDVYQAPDGKKYTN